MYDRREPYEEVERTAETGKMEHRLENFQTSSVESELKNAPPIQLFVELCCNKAASCDKQRNMEESVDTQQLNICHIDSKNDKGKGDAEISGYTQNEEENDSGNWSPNGRGRSRQREKGKRIKERNTPIPQRKGAKIRTSNL